MTKISVLWYALSGGALAVAAMAFAFSRRRQDIIVWLVLGEAVIEAFLYPDQGNVTSKLLYPPSFGRHVRIPEIVIPAALALLVLVRGVPRRFTTTGLAWTAFFLYFTSGLLVGLYNHNGLINTLFDAKATIYVGGGYALTAGMAKFRVTRPAVTVKWLVLLVGLVGFFAVLRSAGTPHTLHIPLLSTTQATFGSDAADCVVPLGALFLAMELCRERVRVLAVLAASVLVLSSLLQVQRAALITTGGVVAVFLLARLGKTWSHRVKLRGNQALWFAALTAIGLVIAVVVAVETNAANPIVHKVHSAITAEGKIQSANARVSLWHQALQLIGQRPIFGWGLGKHVNLHQVYPLPVISVPTHDIFLDLLLWGGVVGLALFLFALGLSLKDAVRAWRHNPDRLRAGLALGAGAGVVGILGLGTVESVFEQFRIATTLGVLLGLIAVAARTKDEEEVVQPAPSPEPTLLDLQAFVPLEGGSAPDRAAVGGLHRAADPASRASDRGGGAGPWRHETMRAPPPSSA